MIFTRPNDPQWKEDLIFKDGSREISLNELVSAMEEILERPLGKKKEVEDE